MKFICKLSDTLSVELDETELEVSAAELLKIIKPAQQAILNATRQKQLEEEQAKDNPSTEPMFNKDKTE